MQPCQTFKAFTVKEIVSTLCLVCKRWKRISHTNMLWRMFPLDEWGINYLSESNLLNIMSHSSGFVYLSMKYIQIQSTAINVLQNSLGHTTKLVHLDFSGMPITSIVSLLVEPVPRLQNLNNCCYKEAYQTGNAVIKWSGIVSLSSSNYSSFTTRPVYVRCKWCIVAHECHWKKL